MCRLAVAAGLLALVPSALAAQPQRHECTTCHSKLQDPRLSQPTRQFAQDVHWQRGFTCAACHGGDPTEPDTIAMDPAKGYIGVPPRARIPEICARCHSDAAFMRKYNPALPIDQFAQYRTSVHGRRLLEHGDVNVATCADCHTPHAIRPASDPTSSVHPMRVPGTCGRCHADAARMAPYGLPTDQLAEYQASVHWRRVAEGADLSAAVCNDCHGDHGATPPGVDAVANACRQCHSAMAQYYDKSVHATVFPSAGLLGCATCHGEHRIEPAGTDLLGLGDKAVCAGCHSTEDAGGKAAAAMKSLIDHLDQRRQSASGILDRAQRAGMPVDQAQFELTRSTQSLVEAWAAVHAGDVHAVEAAVNQGLDIAGAAEARGQQALRELAFRRAGLGVSLVIILLVIAALAMLLRRIEQQPGGGPRVLDTEER